jgi:isoleucyl-tRNA synthetase
MYHIAEAFVRWVAPILSFTADEIWRELPGGREASVFLATTYDGLVGLDANASLDQTFWATVMRVRDSVSRELERLRKQGEIGSSLDAEVTLYCSPELLAQLAQLEDELRFVLITSYASTKPLSEKPADAYATDLADVFIAVQPSEHAKCVRCWHHREDVGQSETHPELCGRCVSNVDGAGETRLYA